MTDAIAQEYPLISSRGKHYREIQVDGKTLWEYPPNAEGQQGAIYDPVAKRLVRGAGIPWTKDNAREMQARGQEAIKRDLLDGMRETVANKRKLHISEVSDATVRQALGAAVMEHALEHNLKGSATVKRLAAELGGMLPERAKVSDAAGNTVSGDAEFVERFLSLAQKVRRESVDGSTED